MDKESEFKKFFSIGITFTFAVLAFIGTTIIRIPIPATGGYFNLGDTFVMAGGLLFGPITGAFSGLIGPTLSDAIGFPQFIPATAIVKCIEGFVIGLIGYKASSLRQTAALVMGILVLTGGYFIFEAVIYPALAKTIPFFGVTDPKAAIAEIIPNLFQGIFSAAIAFGISRVFSGRSKEL